MTLSDGNTTAVLLLAHGTPNALGEMAEYLAKVTGGRALPPEVVAELQSRYSQIGLGEVPGTEPPPLTRWTFAQAQLLESALTEAGHPMRVYAAMRNWHPYIADVVAQMRVDGVARIIAVCLAPHSSRTSTGLYRKALMAVAEGMDVSFVETWSDEPALIEAFAERLAEVYPRACDKASATLPVLFTAHSVPCRTVLSGEAAQQVEPDPYPIEAKRTAKLVFESTRRQLPMMKSWFFAFQSQGVAGGPWIGPSVEETLRALADEGHAGVVLQPIGFLSDHVEILYDIDIAFTQTARQLGLRLYRPYSLNDSPLLIEALAQVVLGRLAGSKNGDAVHVAT